MTRYGFSIAVLGIAALASGCSSTATDSGNAAAQPAEATEQQVALAKDDPNKIRCRTYEVTGSRISKKICKTNAEWDAAARESRNAAETIQRESVQTPGLRGS